MGLCPLSSGAVYLTFGAGAGGAGKNSGELGLFCDVHARAFVAAAVDGGDDDGADAPGGGVGVEGDRRGAGGDDSEMPRRAVAREDGVNRDALAGRGTQRDRDGAVVAAL